MDAVDPSDKPAVRNVKPDMTLGTLVCGNMHCNEANTSPLIDVGTRLYMAPEMEGSEFNAKDILLGKKGPKLKAPKNSKDRRIRASTKADMYSLGVRKQLDEVEVHAHQTPLDRLLRDELQDWHRFGAV